MVKLLIEASLTIICMRERAFSSAVCASANFHVKEVSYDNIYGQAKAYGYYITERIN